MQVIQNVNMVAPKIRLLTKDLIIFILNNYGELQTKSLEIFVGLMCYFDVVLYIDGTMIIKGDQYVQDQLLSEKTTGTLTQDDIYRQLKLKCCTFIYFLCFIFLTKLLHFLRKHHLLLKELIFSLASNYLTSYKMSELS